MNGWLNIPLTTLFCPTIVIIVAVVIIIVIVIVIARFVCA